LKKIAREARVDQRTVQKLFEQSGKLTSSFETSKPCKNVRDYRTKPGSSLDKALRPIFEDLEK
jgi:hypothetical protein